jgi:hypothetical protein
VKPSYNYKAGSFSRKMSRLPKAALWNIKAPVMYSIIKFIIKKTKIKIFMIKEVSPCFLIKLRP